MEEEEEGEEEGKEVVIGNGGENKHVNSAPHGVTQFTTAAPCYAVLVAGDELHELTSDAVVLGNSRAVPSAALCSKSTTPLFPHAMAVDCGDCPSICLRHAVILNACELHVWGRGGVRINSEPSLVTCFRAPVLLRHGDIITIPCTHGCVPHTFRFLQPDAAVAAVAVKDAHSKQEEQQKKNGTAAATATSDWKNAEKTRFQRTLIVYGMCQLHRVYQLSSIPAHSLAEAESYALGFLKQCYLYCPPGADKTLIKHLVACEAERHPADHAVHPSLLAWDALARSGAAWAARLLNLSLLAEIIQRECGRGIDLLSCISCSQTGRPAAWWTSEDDRMLLRGAFYHGYARYDAYATDDRLRFSSPELPSPLLLTKRLKRLLESGRERAVAVHYQTSAPQTLPLPPLRVHCGEEAVAAWRKACEVTVARHRAEAAAVGCSSASVDFPDSSPLRTLYAQLLRHGLPERGRVVHWNELRRGVGLQHVSAAQLEDIVTAFSDDCALLLFHAGVEAALRAVVPRLLTAQQAALLMRRVHLFRLCRYFASLSTAQLPDWLDQTSEDGALLQRLAAHGLQDDPEAEAEAEARAVELCARLDVERCKDEGEAALDAMTCLFSTNALSRFGADERCWTIPASPLPAPSQRRRRGALSRFLQRADTPVFPLTLPGGVVIERLGGDGFLATRAHQSYVNPTAICPYTCSVVTSDQTTLYCVVCADDPEHPIREASAQAAWDQVEARIFRQCVGAPLWYRQFRGDGDERFGLSEPVVATLTGPRPHPSVVRWEEKRD